MTSPYTLPGLPSDLLSSDKPGERRLKVDAEIILPPVEVDLPDDYPLPAAQIAELRPQTDGLTNDELRATPLAVATGLNQPTTPADTQPVSATSLPLPNGAATEAKQLPDNHQVSVSNFPAVQATTEPSHGAFAYAAGISGTVNVPIGGRIRSIMAANTGLTPASLSINGGDSIAVPVGGSFSVEIGGSLPSATITFTGTTQYFVSWVS